MRSALVAALLLGCACPAKKAQAPEPLPGDLSRGGLELVYRVDSPTASMDELLRGVRARLESVKQPAMVMVDQRTLKVQLPTPAPDMPLLVKQLLATPAHLELREVDDGAWLTELKGKEPDGLLVKPAEGGSGRTVMLSLGPTPPAPPPGLWWVHGEMSSAGRVEYTPVKEVSLDNKAIKSAEAQPGIAGGWQVALELTPEGSTAFAELTGRLVNRTLGIVLDGQLLMAPRVMEPIRGGRAMVTLGHRGTPGEQEREARALALGLQTGALAAPLVLVEERQLPPRP